MDSPRQSPHHSLVTEALLGVIATVIIAVGGWFL
jgi:hypothetical protein